MNQVPAHRNKVSAVPVHSTSDNKIGAAISTHSRCRDRRADHEVVLDDQAKPRSLFGLPDGHKVHHPPLPPRIRFISDPSLPIAESACHRSVPSCAQLSDILFLCRRRRHQRDGVCHDVVRSADPRPVCGKGVTWSRGGRDDMVRADVAMDQHHHGAFVALVIRLIHAAFHFSTRSLFCSFFSCYQ